MAGAFKLRAARSGALGLTPSGCGRIEVTQEGVRVDANLLARMREDESFEKLVAEGWVTIEQVAEPAPKAKPSTKPSAKAPRAAEPEPEVEEDKPKPIRRRRRKTGAG